MKYTVASMFAGVGGICLGFKDAGAEIIWANEIDKHACITYRENFGGDYLVEGDIKDINEKSLPDFDILTAGFPCVAFSVAGRRHGMYYKCEACGHEHTVNFDSYITGQDYCPLCQGKSKPKDPRGTLFYDIVRVLRAKRPKAFLLENVKNLVNHDKGNTFRIMKEMLEGEGYHIKYKVLNTMEYGNIPQNRERIFVVGFLDIDAHEKFEFPNKIKLTKTVNDIINIDEKQDDRFYYTEESQYYPLLTKSIKRHDTVYQLRRIYVRENQNNVCPTLTANMGTGGHNVPLIIDNYGIRKLTPRETFLFQGFPEDFVLPEDMAISQLYKQAGNAVSVPVVRRIAENMLKTLNKVEYKTKAV
ncbi:DNA cytosine methyltransferase [Bacillus smithii]|uniref:Cytosine-specific methyltransferase n=1 Tax=Bacillus smithii 7_3_47FAA TaxID=665952 RepID=G9QHK9_9BACI|nr:DNA cytosine methyltransferase [Bacillus smithii]EHL79387.1 DNA (cytosine-5-)-methyltransferase [Bacillus smithii 7_3_47FAA]